MQQLLKAIIIDTGYPIALLEKLSFRNLLKAYDQKCQSVGELVLFTYLIFCFTFDAIVISCSYNFNFFNT